MTKISLKNKLKNGDFVLGTWCTLPSPNVVNILAKSGLDFIIIDMEHGVIDFNIASQMIMAAEAEGCEVIIRVQNNNESDILKALDIGSNGILVPHIETIGDCNKAISYMKYPPIGIRGFSPYTKAGGYTLKENHTSIENEKLLSAIILEGHSGVNNINAIINNINLDLIYLGAYDLSVVYGIPGDVTHPIVIKTLKECTQIIKENDKIAGALFHNVDELEFFKSIGIQLLCYKVDANVLFECFNLIKYYFYNKGDEL